MKMLSHYKAPIIQLGEDVEGYVLDEINGEKKDKPRCVLSKRGSANALGLKSPSGGGFMRTLTSKGVGALLDNNLRKKLENPIIFNYLTPGAQGTAQEIHGYDTTTFIDVLRLILEARRKDALAPNQRALAERAEIMLASLANSSLDSIIYQESGFWHAIEGQKVSEILDKYLQDNARKWAKTFPDDFWIKLIKIKGYPSYYALRRPSFVGHWVNDIIWDRLAPGIRKKLNELNPRLSETGRRKNTHHSFTTKDQGLPELKAHLIKTMAYMDAAANSVQFERMLNRGCPKFGDNYEMTFNDAY